MEKINFQNLPSTSTPLNSTNLNQMQDNMEDAIIPIKLVTISDTAPGSATTGDMYYNTTDNKVYTATGTNTWDSGTTPRYDGFYINTNDNTLFYYNGTSLVGVGGSQTSINVKNEKTTSETDVYSCNYINNMQVSTITNKNGTAIKYADGTMVCYGAITVTATSGSDYYQLCNRTSAITVTFPASFSSTNDLTITVTPQLFQVFSVSISDKTISSFNFNAFYPSTVSFSTLPINYVAFGKWK